MSTHNIQELQAVKPAPGHTVGFVTNYCHILLHQTTWHSN